MHITLEMELYSSKNSKQIVTLRNGKRMLIDSKQSRRQEKILDILLPANKRIWDKMKEGKQYPLKVGLFIYRRTHARFDYINIVQKLFDCMTRYEYWPDDNANYLVPVFLGYAVDKNRPRVEISIL